MSTALEKINNHLKIVLKDIKRENIMIEQQFNETDDIWSNKINFRIIDFGLSTFFDCMNDVCQQCGNPGTVCLCHIWLL